MQANHLSTSLSNQSAALPASTRHKTPKPFSVSASYRPGPGSRTASHRRHEMTTSEENPKPLCPEQIPQILCKMLGKDFPHSHISEDGLSVPRRELSAEPPVIFSEPFRITALQSRVLKAFIILDSHTPGSTAVENSVRVKFVACPDSLCDLQGLRLTHLVLFTNLPAQKVAQESQAKEQGAAFERIMESETERGKQGEFGMRFIKSALGGKDFIQLLDLSENGLEVFHDNFIDDLKLNKLLNDGSNATSAANSVNPAVISLLLVKGLETPSPRPRSDAHFDTGSFKPPPQSCRAYP
ncbi:hypothetical protein MG293_004548 [Ovis ammon polii]|uniref:Uncharacterized protein n=1 Tax=Ovis ammon polii TaxID=230172 RepID=A0AAD4UGK2_OVIAM|nr:hypothetical protein MG293_004548 [Ovis ammon polii]